MTYRCANSTPWWFRQASGYVRQVRSGVALGVYPFFLILPAMLANGGTVACTGTGSDASALQAAVNSGGTVIISGVCSLGTSQISINNPVTLAGPATMVADSGFTDWTFLENVDNVTFHNLTFTNAGIHVTGSQDTKRRGVNFTNCTFQHFNAAAHGVNKYAVIAIDPIWRNSTYNGNTMTDVWLGGFANTNNSNVATHFGQAASASYDMHGLFIGSGLDNSQVEYNTFSQISGNGVKVFGNGLSSQTQGYTASGVSISYNTFTFIHRIGIEIQNMTGLGACTGGCNGFALNYANPKFAGNFFHTPAYNYTETYAYSLVAMGTGHQFINNAAILDMQSNPAAPQARAGYAFEEPPGTGCCGTDVWNGSAIIQGNVIVSDQSPADSKNPGWFAGFVNYGSAAPQLHQNNYLCGPNWNLVIGKGVNEVSQYNYSSTTCSAGAGAALYASNIQAAWTSANNQSFSNNGNGTWSLSVTDNIPIRYVQFFVDNATTPIRTQEIQDLNANFSSNRSWSYHATLDTASLPAGNHILTATVTDVSGASQSLNQAFAIGSGTGSAGAQLTPASLSFGAQTIGLKTASQILKLTNTGAQALVLSSISQSGTNQNDFSSTSTCGASLAASASCDILVSFTPSSNGSENASLLITDNAAGSPHSALLSGTGTTPSAGPPPGTPVLPANLPKGMMLWLANDAGLTLNAGAASTWEDQSGNGNDAVQTIVAHQPALVPGNNGQTALHFDGVSSFMSISFLPIDGLTSMTVFLVSANSKDMSSHAGYGLYGFLNWPETANWGATFFGSYQTSSHFRFGTTQSGNENAPQMPFTRTNSFGLSEWMHAGATDSVWFNAQSIASYSGKWQSIAGDGATVLLGQGSNNTYYPGDVSEVIVYSRSLNTSERQQIEQYLMTKYHL